MAGQGALQCLSELQTLCVSMCVLTKTRHQPALHCVIFFPQIHALNPWRNLPSVITGHKAKNTGMALGAPGRMIASQGQVVPHLNATVSPGQAGSQHHSAAG